MVQVRPDNFRGCPFLMALSEYPDTSSDAHRNAVAMKAWVRHRFGELAAQWAAGRGRDDAERIADHLALIVEGVYASSQALGHDGPASQARSLVEALL